MSWLGDQCSFEEPARAVRKEEEHEKESEQQKRSVAFSTKVFSENKFLKRGKRKDDGLSIVHLCADCLFTRVE